MNSKRQSKNWDKHLSLTLTLKHEVDRNQDLLGRIKKLEEREIDAAKNLSEQVEANRSVRKNQEGLNKKLEERDSRLNTSNQVNTHTHTHTDSHILLLCYFGHVSDLMSAHVCNLFPGHQLFEG